MNPPRGFEEPSKTLEKLLCDQKIGIEGLLVEIEQKTTDCSALESHASIDTTS